MENRRMLILGATGFIGRNVVETFSERDGLEVTGVYNRRPPFEHPGVTWIKADLTDAGDANRCLEDADIVVHAAATTSGAKDITSRPYIHVTDNAVINSLVLRAAFEHKVSHLVFLSCSIMYPSGSRPVREDDFTGGEIHPRYFGAGWTKVYTEKMCEFFAGLGKTKFTVVRHSNIYGPHDKFDLERSHVFGATVTKVMKATNGKVSIWGTGEEARDFLYVDDLVSFVEAAIRHQDAPYALFNVGSGVAVSVRELAEKIIEISGRSLGTEFDSGKSTIKTSLCLDCAKAKRELGWSPEVSLEEGISRTIEWWKSSGISEPS